LYTIQALWSMAREKLNVTTIIFNNATYSVLNMELERVGAQEQAVGAKAKSPSWT
jgi:acetolactate synthase-1/2/3 large subunit